VDDALSSLGESAKQSIYFHLEKKFKITRKDIPNRVQDFQNGLEKIFGLGARFIEILIMKQLYGKIDEPLEWDENKKLEFIEYTNTAKKRFLEAKTNPNRVAP
jgi:hypothetical protein